MTHSVTPLERQLRGEPAESKTTPVDAFKVARRRFVAGERLDMQQLAAELGLHRTTLYRWVGTRDRLIGEILWSLAEPEWRKAVDNGGEGGERVARALEHYMRATIEAPFMRRFLIEEPEIALRVLTTSQSVVQQRSIAATRELIEQEMERGNLDPPLPPEDLAYLIVRIGTPYTDVITGEQPAPEKAAAAVRALLR
jgi:AcrR family transcriptional regulator